MIASKLRLIGALGALCIAVPAHADPALEGLAQQVERTESLRAVLTLQRTYAQYAQHGLWNQLGSLFTGNGTFVFDGLIKSAQTATGSDAIAAFLRNRYGGGYEGPRADGLSTMMIEAPVVNLSADGLTAKARWEVLIFHGHRGSARVEGGMFENDYVREGGVWKIATARYFPEFDGSYDAGWTNWGGGNLPVAPTHYTADTAGIPIPPPVEPAPTTDASFETLRTRIDRLNDEDRIRNLQSAYGYYQDRKMWADVADLFADDGIVEVEGKGVWRGKAGVDRWLRTMGPPGLNHGQLNDRVQFDTTVTIAPGGNEAWARGFELGMLGEADQEKGWWEIAVFQNRFVKENGTWKIRELRRFPIMKTDVFQGWGKNRIIGKVPTGVSAPDSAVPDADSAGPGLAMPAFVAPNPVTGQEVGPVGAAKLVAAAALTGTIPAVTPAPVSLAEAKRRLARSQAFDGVMNVSAAYGHYLDIEDPAGFIGTLATNGFKGGRSGYYVTKASNVRARVRAEPPATRLGISYHWLFQPVVLVSDDGRSASGRMRLFQPRTGKEVGQAGDFFGASFLASTYHNRYVLEDGVWRIWDLTVDPQYIRPVAFKDGIWAKAKDPLPPDPNAPPRTAPLSRGMPQDINASDLGATEPNVQWPAIKPMWFGYTNPVSGRVPELYQPNCVPCTIRPDLRLDANGYQEPPDAPEGNRTP